MNKRIITLMAAALALLSAAGQVAFTGVDPAHHVIRLGADRTTGLDSIYVIYDIHGVGMTYTSDTGASVVWKSYNDSRGEAYAEVVDGISHMGNVSTLGQVKSNTGYVIEEGGISRFKCWVVNYAEYFLSLEALSCGTEESCSLVTLNVDGKADSICYYTITGNKRVLDREITLAYSTLQWDDSTHWQDSTITRNYEALNPVLLVYEPPLCNTVFTLTGDRFLKEWGLEKFKKSDLYYTHAVKCGTNVWQEQRGNLNEKGIDGGYGGSAPVHMVFTGYPTDAVVYRVWEMATDLDFENIILQYYEDEVDYTFTEAGTYYMRYVVANSAGSCDDYSEPVTITVSESDLQCTNVFSPGSTPGVNDVWMVSYKSLVEFHCWIFNRWGNLVYEYTDPGGGWDGTYHGRIVDPGVYYYVITALGSDGVKYKKRGDITILRYKKGAEGTSGSGMDGGGTSGY